MESLNEINISSFLRPISFPMIKDPPSICSCPVSLYHFAKSQRSFVTLYLRSWDPIMKSLFKPFRGSHSKARNLESPAKMTELPSSRFQASTDNPTVIELFQSQGCSSCPPANANVIRLAQDPKYLLLTYEVTYWDRLGWKDTLGSSESDNRQWEYANALGHKSVFTPQVTCAASVPITLGTRD